MHSSVSAVLSGIEVCRRLLTQHPTVPIKAVNRRFDFAATTAGPHKVFRYPPDRWVELRPHTCGIAVQLASGPLRMTAVSLPYPMMPGGIGDDLCPDLDAIESDPFLEALAAAANRALDQLASFPEPTHV